MKLGLLNRISVTAALILWGAYLMGHKVIKETRPITLKEYTAHMTAEKAAQVTEKNLSPNGIRIQVTTFTHRFSMLWMGVGSLAGAALGWVVCSALDKVTK